MEVSTLFYTDREGWSAELPTGLDSERTLILAFGGAELYERPAPIEELAATFPSSHLLGCSTSGEILGTRVRDDSLTVAVARFEHTRLATAFAESKSSSDSGEAAAAVAAELAAPSLRGLFVLSHGQNVNGTNLVHGLNSALPKGVVVTGGLAGDGDRFRRTWVIHEGRPRLDVVGAVGLYGDRVHIGHGSKGGWDIFGPERLVTRSRDNVLYELDGKPALELYKAYLGDRASELPAAALLFPLALRDKKEDRPQVVRTVLGVDEASQSLTFAGDVPEGQLAQLMKANFDRLIDGASRAAEMSRLPATVPGTGDHPTLAIAISCIGRRLVLGARAEEELEHTLGILPAGTQQVGFYSYGEISPYSQDETGESPCELHNQTMTLTTIAEAT